MDPVYTEDCDVVYKGPNQQIGDLRCHRTIVDGHKAIRVTYQPTEEELELLKAGGRVRLFIMKEPIPPVMLTVASKEDSEPYEPHGFKIDVEPGDILKERSSRGGDEGKQHSEETPQGEEGRKETEAIPS